MAKGFDDLVRLMAKLRAPDGCPWDRKQTHESLKPYLLEEAYEVLESIDAGDAASLREELGDLLLQVLFHAQIGSESGRFTIEDVIEGLADKLVRRHPHVFGSGQDTGAGPQPATAADVLARWETIKEGERLQNGRETSALDGVPKTLPALLRAFQLQSRASRVGFDWSEPGPVMAKVEEELEELRDALAAPGGEAGGRDQAAVEAEFGDVLFALVNLARFLKTNPEEALRKATNRFIERFRYIEGQAARQGRALKDMTLAEMDVWWEEAKQRTRESQSGGL